jgi:hypothetical protein
MPWLDQAQCVRDYSSTTQTIEVVSDVVHMDLTKNFTIELKKSQVCQRKRLDDLCLEVSSIVQPYR